MYAPNSIEEPLNLKKDAQSTYNLKLGRLSLSHEKRNASEKANYSFDK
jgi:hypothetical protein